ncbi:NAD(P)/FAD-dependent oxidoreductase [Hoeflea sp. TYP-13]|uniref:NAD(P)/FAD-dependent oxidoreductase n=1 Tax=Hoeflea sp. TYP-13 TaxID=3230023 RepID=UPI0034C5F2A4
MRKLNIAVIGGGIAGLSAAWLLSKGHNVTLFERSDYLGGHALTIDVETVDGMVPVDTGFIVFNESNYPNLCALFRHLNVQSSSTVMSFSLSHDFGRYEYAGCGAGYFGQRRNIASVNHWMMLKEINRFFRNATRRIALYHPETPLGEFLEREHYSRDFIDDHIVPMGAAIWSTSAARMLDFPARAFIDFYANHGMLQFKNRPNWNTVRGGSRTYVEKLVEDSVFETVLQADIQSVTRRPDRVLVAMADGVTRLFDHVVVATHADQALTLLADPDAAERALLQAFPYQENTAVLHRDGRWMPRRNRLWSSWNYIKAGRQSADELCVSYWMNRLQALPTRENLFVTLNPMQEIEPETVVKSMKFDHPVFTAEAFRAQEKMPTLQGYRRTWYCGSYLGYGFHEDGIASGLAVAEKLGGIARPWAGDPDYDRRRTGFEEYLQVAE